ncbi:SDR family oxidoreductase [Streptomyces sp. NPDC002172]
MKIGESWGSREARDLARVSRARKSIGDAAELYMDANGGYGAKQAVRVAAGLDAEGVTWFEEPVSSDRLDALAAVHGRVMADVTVNCAFTSVFAPFTEIAPEEYRRVTEVTYLGFVNGTRAALTRMVPRDRGTVVQVGSALGERAIPLQSAYCAAKHAVNGFTSSVRVELLHQGSNVNVTVAQMPAVNTPQFSWVRSRLPRHPQPVPPIYQPEVAARGVLYAADHPKRKQRYIGATTAATIWANRLAPALLDRYLARTGFDSQQTDAPAPAGPGNLYAPADSVPGTDHGAHGAFDDRSHGHSVQAALARHPAVTAATTTALTVAAVGGARRLLGTRGR